jgi:rubrerythrin
MEQLKDLSLHEILAVAMKAEVSAAEGYMKLADAVHNPILKEKLIWLSKAEKNHLRVLEKIYVQNLPDKPIDQIPLDRTEVPAQLNVEIDSKMPWPRALELAMKGELEAEKFYQWLAQQVKDLESIKMLKYLAKLEHGHYNVLKTEYDYLTENPDFYGLLNTGDYNMFHLGT